MSFDMAGSLTSTPTHSRIATSTHFPPNAQSTPVTTVQRTLGQVSILNTPDPGQENQASAHSTPKLSKFSPTGPNSQQRQNGEAPRTPTPFKRALAEVHRRREPLSNTPQTPTKLVDDINDIIKKDMLDDIADLSYTSPVLSSNQQVLLNSISCNFADAFAFVCILCHTYEHYSSECICLLHRPCKTAVTPATLRRGGARGRWTTGTRRTPAPTRTRYTSNTCLYQ